MSSSLTLAQVLDRPDVWRGDTLARAPLPGVPTGFAELDRELPGGGWPRGGLTEILPLRRGIGELSLLLPALARCRATNLPGSFVWPRRIRCMRQHCMNPVLICRVCWWPALPVGMPPGSANAHSLPMVLAQWSPGCRKSRAAHCVGCSLLPRAVAHCCSFFVRQPVPVNPRRRRCVWRSKARGRN
jgi:hypothetical protein